ncbi:MAG TPA: GNAT family N-acetyltransferase [Solirubrobacteraceae bacterium]
MAFDVDVTPTASDRPRPDGGDIRKITPDEVQPVAQTLARAFLDDPHFRFIVRDDAKRLARMERGFATFVGRIWLPQDEGYAHEQLIGAALWMPPETWHMSVLAQLRLLPAIVASARGDTGRLLKAVNWMERKHPREPHWYLPAIGVTPAWQGRGYGAALLRPMLDRLDAERVPAYLEASTPRNLALYGRHGFEVVEEGRYARDAPPLWRMWREPKS